MSLLDGLGMGGPRSTEESMRVTYEDPGQAEQKRRLLRMLGGDEGEADAAAGVVAVMRRLGVGGVARGGDDMAVGKPRRTKRAKVAGF